MVGIRAGVGGAGRSLLAMPVKLVLYRVVPVTESRLEITVPHGWRLCGRQRRRSGERGGHLRPIEAHGCIGRGRVPAAAPSPAAHLADAVVAALFPAAWLHAAAGARVVEAPGNVADCGVPTAAPVSALRLVDAHVAAVRPLVRVDGRAQPDAVAVREQQVVYGDVTGVTLPPHAWRTKHAAHDTIQNVTAMFIVVMLIAAVGNEIGNETRKGMMKLLRRKPEAGSRKLEAGSCKPEAGSWKPEAGSRGLALPLPRVINFKFLQQPHQKYYITQ